MHVGQHVFPREVLAAYREAVDDESMAGKLEKAFEAVDKNGDNEVGGEHYKRVPRGYDADHPRQELLRYNGLWAKSPTIDARLRGQSTDRLVGGRRKRPKLKHVSGDQHPARNIKIPECLQGSGE